MSAILHRLGVGWGSVCSETETLVKKKKKEGHFCARLTGKATLAHSSQKLRLGFLEVVTKGKSLMMRTNLLQTYSALTAIARHQGTSCFFRPQGPRQNEHSGPTWF